MTDIYIIQVIVALKRVYNVVPRVYSRKFSKNSDINKSLYALYCFTHHLPKFMLLIWLVAEVFYDQNDSYEITINGFQVRKINEINEIRNVPFLLRFLFRLFF